MAIPRLANPAQVKSIEERIVCRFSLLVSFLLEYKDLA